MNLSNSQQISTSGLVLCQAWRTTEEQLSHTEAALRRVRLERTVGTHQPSWRMRTTVKPDSRTTKNFLHTSIKPPVTTPHWLPLSAQPVGKAREPWQKESRNSEGGVLWRLKSPGPASASSNLDFHLPGEPPGTGDLSPVSLLKQRWRQRACFGFNEIGA